MRRVLRERRQQLGCGNAHSLAVQRAFDGKTHMPVFQGEQGVVFADADVITGMELGATLPSHRAFWAWNRARCVLSRRLFCVP